MGYTHYWRWHPALAEEKEKFTLWAGDVWELVTNSPVPLANGHGVGQPTILPTGVCFNGQSPNEWEAFHISLNTLSDPENHRRFQWSELPKFTGWSICKTRRLPYDVVVTAALIRLAYRFPEGVYISSDGEVEEWQPGKALCEKLFGFGVVPLTQIEH